MSEINIKPIAGSDNRVIVEPVAAETTTASGIIIPDSAKEKPLKAVVKAVSDDRKEDLPTVKVGDTVIYGKYAGTELNHEGVDYLILKESDILAIIK